MSDVDSKALMCARVNPFLAVPPARGQDSAPSVLLTLLAACFLKPTLTTAAFHPPGHSRWIVTMSPIFGKLGCGAWGIAQDLGAPQDGEGLRKGPPFLGCGEHLVTAL